MPDGHYSCTAFRAGFVRFDVLRSVLCHTVGGNRYGSWNLLRWMEDSSHNGHEDHKVAPVRRVQRRDRGCLNTLRYRISWNPRQHNSHNSWGDHGRRFNPQTLSGEMGGGSHNSLRLGAHEPARRTRSRKSSMTLCGRSNNIGGSGSRPRRCIFQVEAAVYHRATRPFHLLEPTSWPGSSMFQTRVGKADPLRKRCSSRPPSILQPS